MGDPVKIALEALAERDHAIINLSAPEDASSPDAGSLELALLQFAEQSGLGRPYTPAIYASTKGRGFTTANGINHVGGPAKSADHPAFSTREAVPLHTDATLSAISEVPVSILVCIQPARAGGESVVVQTSQLMEALLDRVEELAPLFDSRALRRHTTIGSAKQHADGPVFMAADGRVYGRYSVTPRDEWRFDVVPGLRAARRLFDAKIRQRREFVHIFRLEAGQALILRNDRVSHGRRPFASDPIHTRHLIRALFRQGSAHSGVLNRGVF